MRALTVRQPWAWAIMHAGKDIENRSWLPAPAGILGERIAVHASLGHDAASYEAYADLTGHHAPRDLPRGVVLGSVMLAGWVASDGSASDPSLQRFLQSRWLQGPYGWVLQAPRPANELVACRGALGLWRLPADLLAQVAP